MKVKTLDNEEYDWKIPERIAKGNKRKSSKGHGSTKEILKNIYKNVSIYEEVPFICERYKQLYLDFFIPSLNLAIEVQGKQHYEYCPHFHQSKLHFLLNQANDNKKAEWCKLNGITLIILPYNQEKEWTKLLTSYC